MKFRLEIIWIYSHMQVNVTVLHVPGSLAINSVYYNHVGTLKPNLLSLCFAQICSDPQISAHYNIQPIILLIFSRKRTVRRCVKLLANGHNNSQHCCVWPLSNFAQQLATGSWWLTMLRPFWRNLNNDDGGVKENGKKAIGLDWQNNSCACASHFFGRLRRENT